MLRNRVCFYLPGTVTHLMLACDISTLGDGKYVTVNDLVFAV